MHALHGRWAAAGRDEPVERVAGPAGRRSRNSRGSGVAYAQSLLPLATTPGGLRAADALLKFLGTQRSSDGKLTGACNSSNAEERREVHESDNENENHRSR